MFASRLLDLSDTRTTAAEATARPGITGSRAADTTTGVQDTMMPVTTPAGDELFVHVLVFVIKFVNLAFV